MSRRPTDYGEREDENKLFLKNNRNVYHSKTNSQQFFQKTTRQ